MPNQFKAWDTKERKWIEEFTINKYGQVGEETMYDGFIPNHDAILIRFTGLFDENKKPIYDKDIVKGQFIEYNPCTDGYIKREKMGGVIFWSYAGYQFKVIESMCDKKRDGMVNYFDFTDNQRWSSHFSDMKALGSSLDHPELIK